MIGRAALFILATPLIGLAVLGLSNPSIGDVSRNVAIAFGLLGFAFAILSVGPKAWIEVGVVNAASVQLALFCANIYVREVYAPLETGARAGSIVVAPLSGTRRLHSNDWRTKSEVLTELRGRGIDAWPLVPPGLFMNGNITTAGGGVALPLGGISNVTTVACNEYGEWMIYSADRFGFNNPQESWSRPDLALLGDSFTFGSCVPAGQDIAARLRVISTRSTLNLGMAMTGPLFVLARIKEYLTDLRPADVVYIYYEGNDLQDLLAERHSPGLSAYLAPQSFVSHVRQSEIDAALRAAADRAIAIGEVERSVDSIAPDATSNFMADVVFLRSMRLFFGFHRGEASYPLDGCVAQGPYAEENIRAFAGSLRDMRETVAAWGGRLHVFYMPDYARYFGPSIDPECFAARGRVLATIAALGLPLVDFAAAIRRGDYDASKLWAGPGLHFGPEGYSAAADFLIRNLATQMPVR